jgi:preprotein translocase subunit SecB
MSDKPEYVGHIRLDSLHCSKAVYSQAFVPVDCQRLPADLGLNIQVSLRCRDTGDGPVAVDFRVRVPSDKEGGQPYDVEVEYVGRFTLGNLPQGLTRESFARKNAVAIMFPFVRSTIADITMRGSVGPLLVPPVNVVAMLEENKVREDDPVPA